MNLFEFAGCAVGVVGALAGGVVGHSLFGWLGAAIGVSVGTIGGWVAGAGVVDICFAIGILKERLEQHHRLRKHFGRFWARDRASEWKTLVEHLPAGQELAGKVVSQFYYGVFVDTGHGFPALLKIGDSKYGIHAPQAAVGCYLSARVLSHDDRERFIELTQKDDASAGESVQQSAGGDAENRAPQQLSFKTFLQYTIFMI